VKKIIVAFCLLAFLVQLLQIVFFQRGVLTEKYDVAYWKDRYEHSQYQLPLSKRSIGDDALHAYAGYRLINGDNPFSINNDKPPFGKYLLGLSIILFNNPIYITFFFGFLSLIVFYFIAKNFFKESWLALLATTFVFLDPLIFSQFWIAELDLPQLFFFLLNILLLINLKKTKGWNVFLVLGSGLSLGLFTEIKPPILLPIIFILETIFFIRKGLIKEYLCYIFGLFLGVILPYLRFIYLGNGIVDIFRVHKYVAAIYLQSQLKAHIGAIWSVLMSGQFPNIITGSMMKISEWSVLWPIITIFGVLSAFRALIKRENNIFLKGLSIFVMTILLIFTFIPSYPRYLVLVLPFLYLFGLMFTQIFISQKKIIILSLILVAYGVVNSFVFLLPKPDIFLNGLYYSISHLYFSDVYQEDIGNKNELNITRDQFRLIASRVFNDAQVKEIDVKELSSNVSAFSKEGYVKVRFTYKTQNLGQFFEDKTIKLFQSDGEWRIRWDWNIIFNDFSPQDRIDSQIQIGNRGSIVKDGIYLAQDENGYLLSLNPGKIDLKKEEAMLKTFSFYGYKPGVHFQNAYLENVLPDSEVPIMTLSQQITQEEKSLLLSYPGVSLSPYQSRIYAGLDAKSIENTFYKECCSRIYSSYNYHGINGVEKEFDRVLWGYSGGKILMKDSNGDIIRTLYEKNKKDGKDIAL
jgi:hypothetical protein